MGRTITVLTRSGEMNAGAAATKKGLLTLLNLMHSHSGLCHTRCQLEIS